MKRGIFFVFLVIFQFNSANAECPIATSLIYPVDENIYIPGSYDGRYFFYNENNGNDL